MISFSVSFRPRRLVMRFLLRGTCCGLVCGVVCCLVPSCILIGCMVYPRMESA